MQFANFEEFRKALDQLHKRSVRLKQAIKKVDGRRKAAGIPASKQLVARCRRLEKAAEKLLKISQEKEKAYQARQAAAKAKPRSRRRND